MFKIKSFLILFLFLSSCNDSKSLKKLPKNQANHITTDSIKKKKKFNFNINDYHVRKIGFKGIQLSGINISELKNVNLTIEDRKIKPFNREPEYFYYSVLDTTNYYSVVYYYNAPYESCLTLVNFTKSGNYIDNHDLYCFGGDEDFYQSKVEFLNDSIYMKYYEEGHYLYDDLSESRGKVQKGKKVVKKNIIKLGIQKNGMIKVDTLMTN